MSINKTYNGGQIDGRAPITNHCTSLNEGVPMAANAYNIVLCAYRARISLIVGQDNYIISLRL